MTPQQISRLFQPFTQGDSSVTRAYGGSGLGLAISKRLIEMLHGDISVSSQPGKGSLFSAHLPVEIPDDVALEPLLVRRVASEPILTPPRDLDCKVLIADDRRDVRFISQHFLEAAGACVVAVEDGRLAMDAVCAATAQNEPFDIIVLDMQMPQMDGYQAAAAMRKLGCAQPIIALTADAMKGDRERCLLAGCDDYISKPIQQSQFVDIIARYTQDFDLDQLRRRRAEQLSSLRDPTASGRK